MTATMTGLGQALVDILGRGGDAQRVQDQARAVGGCEHPIRLHGHVDTVDRATGELETRWPTGTLPDGVAHTRCNNRRASRCEPCSRLYQQDAWQLVVSGLAGGKGVPDTVAGHPTLSATLTAPSFGPAHARVVNDQGQTLPCRARRDEADQVREHGRPLTCTKRQAENDPCLGRPLCMDCWDYAGAVLWNAHASELWRRTRIRVCRELAALAGISERQLRREVSVSYVKVAEYQCRGLVRLHVLVRLDAARPPAVERLGVPWRLPHRIAPPPATVHRRAARPSGPRRGRVRGGRLPRPHPRSASRAEGFPAGKARSTLDARPDLEDGSRGSGHPVPYPAEALRHWNRP